MKEPVRVKVCGLTRAEDVRAAVRAGADYLGFVFVPGGPRAVDPGRVVRMLDGVATRPARRVGVFRDQPARYVNEVVQRCRLDLVQLHGHEPRDYAAALTVPVLRVVRVPMSVAAVADGDASGLESGDRVRVGERLPLAPNVEALLVDVEDAGGRSGGLGIAADPAALIAMLARLVPGTRVFLSGGLDPDNVAALVRAHRPFGVDAASGLETAPGLKDPERLAAFVRAAKGAT